MIINYLSAGAGFLPSTVSSRIWGAAKKCDVGEIFIAKPCEICEVCWKSIYDWTKSPVYVGLRIVDFFPSPKRSGLGSEIICPECLKGFGVFSSCVARISHVWIIGGWNCDIFFSSPAMVIPKMNRPPNSEVYLCLDLFLNLYENKRKTCFNKKVRVKNWR